MKPGLMTIAVGTLFAAGCHKAPPPQPVAGNTASPQQSAAEFQAERDAEVARQVAENKALIAQRDAAQEAAETQERQDAQAANIARLVDKVRNALKDPPSALFSDLAMAGDAQTLCGFVNSKNSYGGYVGKSRFVSSDAAVMVESSDNKALMDAAWSTFGCK